MVMAIIAIFVTLILVVGLHELGHALAARVFKVKIKKISLGFGKALVSLQSKSGCVWVWAMWPLGGYVELLNSRIRPVDAEELPFCFDKQAPWKRLIILISGSLTNLLIAWLFFVLVFFTGILYKLPQVQSVSSQSIAEKAGIRVDDTFLAVNNKSVISWQDVMMELVLVWGETRVKLTVKNNSDQKVREAHMDLSQVIFSEASNSLLTVLGIVPDLSAPNQLYGASSWSGAVHQANAAISHFLHFFMVVLVKLVTGVLPFSVLLGPLGLFAASVASLLQGMMVFLYFIAALSLAVAFVNLFPLPGLDGGSIVYVLIEKWRGKPVSVALEVLLHRLIVIVFAILLVQLVMSDLNRLIKFLV